MARRVSVYTSRGNRPDAAVYRAVAYEEEDTFRQPVWMCSHDHVSFTDAESCGAAWQKDQSEGKDAQT